MTESTDKARDVTNQLWAMANELRSTMDAGEYRNYILGIMFYRYLSERQEAYIVRQDLLSIEPNQSVNEAFRQQATGDDLGDYLTDIAGALGYAIPPEYTWATIVHKVNEDEIAPSDFQDMFDEFKKYAQLNKNAQADFQGIFADINLGNSRLGTTTAARGKSLSNIVSMIDKFDYNDAGGHDILGDVYEYLIAQFASNSGKKAGEFYTPHQVSEILAKLVTLNRDKNQEHFSVFDPAMGSGSLLLTVGSEMPGSYKSGRVQFHGQEINTTTFNLARMNLMMHGVAYQNMTLRNADSLEMDWPDGLDSQGVDHPRSFDAVVENPPYSAQWDNQESKLKDPRFKDYELAPKSKADFAFLLDGFYHLNSKGTMAIVLPHGVLFRGAKEGKIRQALLDKHQIDAIIGLPSGLFYSTGIPTIIMVLKRQRQINDVLFIDASRDFEKGKNQNNLRNQDIDKIINAYVARKDVDKYAHVASMDEIKENEYNLNIPRYVDTFEPEPPVDIDKLLAEKAKTDDKITQLEAEFSSMLNDLTGTTPDAQQQLTKIKEWFKND